MLISLVNVICLFQLATAIFHHHKLPTHNKVCTKIITPTFHSRQNYIIAYIVGAFCGYSDVEKLNKLNGTHEFDFPFCLSTDTRVLNAAKYDAKSANTYIGMSDRSENQYL